MSMERRDGQWAERDIFNIGEIHGDVIIQNHLPPTRDRNEQILLRTVKDEIESRLASSLHNAVFLTLGKEAQSEQVKRPWDREVKIGAKAATTIPNEMSITQVFDAPEIRGKLLILGHPGSGKTTTLLDLAKSLAEKAEASPSYPIPLLFNLSSWQNERQSIRDWMALEMKSKYGVSRKLGQKWIEERMILPLLDGLDEVTSKQQENCAKRINEFMTDPHSPLYVVVCSRFSEYKNYETKLSLGGAVYLKPLSNIQIQEYLTKINRLDLWNFLSQDTELLEFLSAPLLLSILILTYPQNNPEQWSKLKSADDRVKYLLDSYIERMLNRELRDIAYPKKKIPSIKQTRKWLIWLAQEMEQSSQTEFLIEEMQPSLLPIKQKKVYKVIFRLIIGLRYGLGNGLFFGIKLGIKNGLSFGLNTGISVAIISTLASSFIIKQEPKIVFVERLKFSWPIFFNAAKKYGILSGIICGLIGAIGAIAISLKTNIAGIFFGIIIFIIFSSIFFGGILGSLNGLYTETVHIKSYPNQSIKLSARNYIKAWMISSIVFAIIFITRMSLINGIGFGVILGMIFGSIYGGLTCIQHAILRLFLYQSNLIPWNYSRFLDYSTELLFLQRIGGKYRFIHRLLQEHFAETVS